MKNQLRCRLSTHCNPSAYCWGNIIVYLDRIYCYYIILSSFHLCYLSHSRTIKARMQHGKDKTPAGTKQPCECFKERPNLSHIKESHIAERRIEPSFA